MMFRLLLIGFVLIIAQVGFTQEEFDLNNTYTFANGVEVKHADDWRIRELQDGVTVFQRRNTDLIFATSPFIISDEFVSLAEVMVSALELADTPAPPEDSIALVDFGNRFPYIYSYPRDDTASGIVIVIRMRDGSIGTLDVVTVRETFADEQAEVTAMLESFDFPADEDSDDEPMYLSAEQEFALNANWRGIQSYNGDDLNIALQYFDTAIEYNPDYAPFYDNRASVLLDLGREDLAIDDLTTSIELDSESEFAYFDRAYAYVQQGEYELAIADQTEAIRLNPTNPLYYTDRGATKRRLGDFVGAIEDYDLAIELAPDDPVNYFVRAMALAYTEDFEAASADYVLVYELDPEFGNTIHLIQHYVEEDYEAAITGYSNNILREPEFAPLYFHRGNAYRQLNDTDNALADLETYIELAGDNADPRALEWIEALSD